jgi:hypothetical protein
MPCGETPRPFSGHAKAIRAGLQQKNCDVDKSIDIRTRSALPFDVHQGVAWVTGGDKMASSHYLQ